MNTQISPRSFVIMAGLAAIAIAISLSASVAKTVDAGSGDLRVGLACTPTTDAQSYNRRIIVSGDPQLCRVKVQHRGEVIYLPDGSTIIPAPILGVTYSHPTRNKHVSISAEKRDVYGTTLATVPCSQQTFTCDPVDLGYGEFLFVVENLQFDIGQDGLARTRAYATGTQSGAVITSSALETRTLP